MALVGAISAGLVFPIARREVVPARGEDHVDVRSEAVAAFAVLARDPYSRLLVQLFATESIVLGALDVLYVVLAIGVLGLGNSGAGYLNAAFGVGGTVAIAATATLVGRRHLVAPLVLGGLIWSVAFVVLGVRATTAGAFLLIAAAGVGRVLFDVSGRTLLQRTAPSDVLARMFGIVEGLSMVEFAIGSIAVPALIALGGARAALFGVAAVFPLLVLLGWKRLAAADAAATVPVVEIALLRRLPMFAALPPPTLERLAHDLERVDAEAGTVVMHQGDRGDRFYVIADGEAAVEVDGEQVATRGRGEGVGEIALLRNVPRTATVRALTPLRLYALAADPFIAAVTGHDPSAHAAEQLIAERAPATA
jgi:hypothetical protein